MREAGEVEEEEEDIEVEGEELQGAEDRDNKTIRTDPGVEEEAREEGTEEALVEGVVAVVVVVGGETEGGEEEEEDTEEAGETLHWRGCGTSRDRHTSCRR